MRIDDLEELIEKINNLIAINKDFLIDHTMTPLEDWNKGYADILRLLARLKG